jgi:hypothetical protein
MARNEAELVRLGFAQRNITNVPKKAATPASARPVPTKDKRDLSAPTRASTRNINPAKPTGTHSFPTITLATAHKPAVQVEELSVKEKEEIDYYLSLSMEDLAQIPEPELPHKNEVLEWKWMAAKAQYPHAAVVAKSGTVHKPEDEEYEEESSDSDEEDGLGAAARRGTLSSDKAMLWVNRVPSCSCGGSLKH